MERFRRLALTSAVAVLTLVAVGGLVRATGSGLGCLDEWPTCKGGWIAPFEYHAVIEYAHRALAGVIVLLLAVQAFFSFRWVPAYPRLKRWSVLAVIVVLAQAALGRVVVTESLHAALVTAHFVLAMTLVAITVRIAAGATFAGRPRATGEARRMIGLSGGAVVGIFVLLLVGAYVREKGAGLAFPDWPLMDGSLLPDLSSHHAAAHFAHRLLALLVGGHLVAVAMRGRRDDRGSVRMLSSSLAGLYAAQIVVGAANVWTRLAPAAVLGHVALGALTWAAAVALTVAARYASPPGGVGVAADGPSPTVGERIGAYVRLTKPRIITLLLVTTVPAMVLAERGLPSGWLVLATLFGGSLTAGSANAINQYLERDIDERMDRTKGRPLPSHSVEPRGALVFGLLLGVAGYVWLAVLVNQLAALLAVAAILFYVLIYTVLLKRNTPQNIVIGGAAGAVPVLVGWAAVTGSLAAPAWIMFAIVFVWTPPHFWALAMRYRDDYARAGVPMMPVVRGDRSTTGQILGYIVLLIPITLALSPVAGMTLMYLSAAAMLGGWFLYLGIRLRRDPSAAEAMRLFRYSINYLALLFGAIVVDRVLAPWTPMG